MSLVRAMAQYLWEIAHALDEVYWDRWRFRQSPGADERSRQRIRDVHAGRRPIGANR